MIFKIILLLIGIFVCQTEATPGPPLILVPGDGGSQLEAKLQKKDVVHYICAKTSTDYFNIWLNLELLVPVIIDCLIDNLRLEYDNVTRTTHSPEGVSIRVPGFGNSSTVEWLDPSHASQGSYFKDIANILVELGYRRDDGSLRGAPYDFRKAPNEHQEWFKNMKNLVEDTYSKNGNQSVLLLAHSMGGPMCLNFLHQQSQIWKDKYIRALIGLNAAWAGSVKSLKVFIVGDNLGTFVLRESTLKTQQITSPSLAWLLPSPLFWKQDEILISTDKRNYTLQNLQDFFIDIDYITGWEMWKDVEPYSKQFSPPGVEVHCLHGFDVQTIDRLMFKPGTFPLNDPSYIYGDGDGTVNLRSLEACAQWQGLQKQKVYHQKFSKMNHIGILSDPRIFDYLRSLMKKL